MKPSISIIGCGWLGLPLAQMLLERNYSVKGSTTNPEKLPVLRNLGIEPYLMQLNPDLQGDHLEALFQSEVIIVNIPPGLRHRPAEFHIAQIESLLARIEGGEASKVIFVSATSVYPDHGGVLSETDLLQPENTGNLTLLKVENMFRASGRFSTSVLRLGGLLGYDRIPGRYFAGKTDVEGKVPINYIHRDDAVGFIYYFLEKALWGETYNVVAPITRVRQEVFDKNVKDFALTPISYSENPPIFLRRINTEKIQKSGYPFKYPDPLDFYYEHQ